MYDDINVLEYVYQTAKTSQEIVARVLKLNIEGNRYNEVLKQEFSNNKKISLSASHMLKRRKKDPKEISVFSKFVTYMSVKKNLSGNKKEDENIINIVIQNGNQIIDELSVKLNESKIKSKSIINLIQRFIYFENETLERLSSIKEN